MKFDGEGLRRERKALQVPIDTLAAVAGVSGCWLSKIERGAVAPNEETARRLLAAMTMLESLAMQVQPMKLDFSEVGALRKLLEQMERGATKSRRPAPSGIPAVGAA